MGKTNTNLEKKVQVLIFVHEITKSLVPNENAEIW